MHSWSSCFMLVARIIGGYLKNESDREVIKFIFEMNNRIQSGIPYKSGYSESGKPKVKLDQRLFGTVDREILKPEQIHALSLKLSIDYCPVHSISILVK